MIGAGFKNNTYWTQCGVSRYRLLQLLMLLSFQTSLCPLVLLGQTPSEAALPVDTGFPWTSGNIRLYLAGAHRSRSVPGSASSQDAAIGRGWERETMGSRQLWQVSWFHSTEVTAHRRWLLESCSGGQRWWTAGWSRGSPLAPAGSGSFLCHFHNTFIP